MKNLLFAVLMLAPSVAWAQRYSLSDAGEFEPLGQRVEFADRFGWQGYKVDFDFSLDASGRSLADGSRLTLRIDKKGGGHWNYACKAGSSRELHANVNYLTGGISVVASCRIEARSFAKAVELDSEDVGAPVVVFQALIADGKVLPGAQRGIHFEPAVQIAAAELSAYTSADDASGLAVVFRSSQSLQ